MTTEERRFQLQQALDKSKSLAQRNVLGQYATPFALAKDIVSYAIGLCQQKEALKMLEPACGTGVFFSALQHVLGTDKLEGSLGFEVDPHYHDPSAKLWKAHGVDIRCRDFLSQEPCNTFPLLIANPPYSRHHHLTAEQKQRLQAETIRQTGIKLSGLSGLYCYFMMLSTRWLQKDGLSCWLIPSEFMDVNYGEAVKQYLLEKVDLIRIHRFDEKDLQFADALVTSSIVVFRNAEPSGRPISFSYGSSICTPAIDILIEREQLNPRRKWNHFFNGQRAEYATGMQQRVLGDYFEVKRGIATGSNSFFVVNEETIARYGLPKEYLTPVLPAPRKMNADIIQSNNGIPAIAEPLYLFSTNDSPSVIANKYPSVLEYIKKGEEAKVHETYICSRHTPWYSCEKRRRAPFVIPYMGRGENGKRMFRFILNNSDAIATNGYLMMYPKPEYADRFHAPHIVTAVWKCLNTVNKEEFESNGRFYGGGLHKLEPKELLSIPVQGLEPLLGGKLFSMA